MKVVRTLDYTVRSGNPSDVANNRWVENIVGGSVDSAVSMARKLSISDTNIRTG